MRTGHWMVGTALVATMMGFTSPAQADRGNVRRVEPVVVAAPAHGPRPVDRVDARPADLPRADGAVTGRVERENGKHLVVDPYDRKRADLKLRFDDRVPVYEHGRRVTAKRIDKGDDVRVHFALDARQKPVAVAVELLSAHEARLERLAAQPAPAHWRSNASHAGRVTQVRDGHITFDPYQRSVGETRLRLDDGTPVYRDGRRVKQSEVRRGEDVRVYFAGRRVVAIELLDSKEARKLERELKNRRS